MSLAKDNEIKPRRIGVYRLHEEIGAGAMGKVYRATHETLGKSVALKIVHTDDPSGEVSARFLQEGVAASRIRHPNVVEILDAGSDNGVAYMAMQLLDGETLADCLSRQGRLPLTYAIDLILPVCAALAAAHDAGVLHRDLKPANIFLADVGRGDPEPILLDFGISKILGPVDPELTQNPRFLGSPLYIAPEQADGAPGSPLSDQYSLALTLYEVVLGVRPFAKFTSSLIQLLRHVAEGDIRRPRELDESIPEDLDIALSRALSTDPTQRFGSVRDLGAALLPFASQARRTLWQQSFVDAERTMTSANSPISESDRSSRPVAVSVEGLPPTNRSSSLADSTTSIDDAQNSEDFLSHSSLFGGETSSNSFDPAQSSISVRDGAFSQVPSGRASGAWSGAAPAPRRTTREHGPSARALIVTVGIFAFVIALLISQRPWHVPPPATYSVVLSAQPPAAVIHVDGQEVGRGAFIGKFKKDGSAHQMRISLEGHEPQTIVFRDAPPPDAVTLSPLSSAPKGLGEPSARRAPESNNEGVTADEPPSEKRQLTPAPQPPSKKPTARAVTPPQPPADAVAPASGAQKPEPTPPQREVAKDPPKVERPAIKTGNLDPWAQ